jgi:hypothetical protein
VGSNTEKPTMELNYIWKKETFWLLEISSFGQFTTLGFQKINAVNST